MKGIRLGDGLIWDKTKKENQIKNYGIIRCFKYRKGRPCCEAGSESYGSLMLSLGSRCEDRQAAKLFMQESTNEKKECL